MDYFSPGIREISRISARWLGLWKLRGARKELARVETELGLLGWQQAEFDEDTQREVDKILECEREQARLTNESAALSRTIAELKEQREQARLAFEQKNAPLVQERRILHESIAKLASHIPSLRRQLSEQEDQAKHFERELRQATRLYNDLLASDAHTPESRDKQTELRERTTSIPGQIAEVQRRHARTQVEIDEAKKTLAGETERETALTHQVKEMESAHSSEDRKLADTISAKEREREKIEAENAKLDKAKTNPYREIGIVLADNQLPPMNQPQALDAVRESRLRVQELEYSIAKSRADSEAEDRALVQNSLILLGAVAVALLLVLGAIIEW